MNKKKALCRAFKLGDGWDRTSEPFDYESNALTI
jgi:hypothetical protein